MRSAEKVKCMNIHPPTLRTSFAHGYVVLKSLK